VTEEGGIALGQVPASGPGGASSSVPPSLAGHLSESSSSSGSDTSSDSSSSDSDSDSDGGGKAKKTKKGKAALPGKVSGITITLLAYRQLMLFYQAYLSLRVRDMVLM
jgi:hypothetical protein